MLMGLGRASDPAPPAVLLDHHERAETSAAEAHWRRRCDGETTVVEDGDDGAEQWIWIFPLRCFLALLGESERRRRKQVGWDA
jgi:hypothetical protein